MAHCSCNVDLVASRDDEKYYVEVKYSMKPYT